jgi:hypothetical protein
MAIAIASFLSSLKCWLSMALSTNPTANDYANDYREKIALY